jgi:hypothetical protein
MRRHLIAASLLVSAGIAACLYPTERSGELEVRMTQIPTLFLKDSLELQARVVDADGEAVPNAVITYSSGDPAVAIVTRRSPSWMPMGCCGPWLWDRRRCPLRPWSSPMRRRSRSPPSYAA